MQRLVDGHGRAAEAPGHLVDPGVAGVGRHPRLEYDWFNNTAYANRGAAFDMLADGVLSGTNVHRLRNHNARGFAIVALVE